MSEEINPVFKELFEEQWYFRIKLNKGCDLNELKKEVKGFIDECVNSSSQISDIDERDRLYNFISFWRVQLFPDEFFPPIHLNPPQKGYILQPESTLTNLTPLPLAYYKDLPIRKDGDLKLEIIGQRVSEKYR